MLKRRSLDSRASKRGKPGNRIAQSLEFGVASSRGVLLGRGERYVTG